MDASGDFVYQVGQHLGWWFQKRCPTLSHTFSKTVVVHSTSYQSSSSNNNSNNNTSIHFNFQGVQDDVCEFQNSKELVMIEITLIGSTLVSDFSSSKGYMMAT